MLHGDRTSSAVATGGLLSSVVFLSNLGKHNYESLASYGAMRPVTQGNYNVFKTERLKEEIIECLLDSSPTDFLALSGSTLVAAICLEVWLILHGKVQLLIFDPRQDQYVPRVFDRGELLLTIEKARDKAAREKEATGR